jgi:hypothetical protein
VNGENIGGEHSNDDDDDDDDDDEYRDRDQVLSSYKLELVLRKWFAIDPSREMRAFVLEGVLIGAFVRSFISCKFSFALHILSSAKGNRYIAA